MSSVSTAPSLIGRLVAGRYRVEKQIGQGGMGAIFLATQEPLGRSIVLKVLLEAFAHDHIAVTRFEKEALSISRLVHPHIVTLFDFGHTEHGELFIAMEYLHGRSLRELLYHHGAMDWRRAARIIVGIAKGLAEAHRHGIIHRDLKPENIMLVRSGDDEEFPKILDFGLARSLDTGADDEGQRVTQQNMIPGTPAYIAPERAGGLDDDMRSDLYSLGAMWFELVTGEVPFDAPTPIKVIVKHLQEPPRKPSQVAPDNVMPPALEQTLLSLLEKRPDDRLPDASELLRRTQPYLSGEHWAAASAEELSDPRRPAPPPAIVAWAAEASEIPDLDFGSALGLDDEPMLLTIPKTPPPIAPDEAPIELVRRKDFWGPDVIGATLDQLEPLSQPEGMPVTDGAAAPLPKAALRADSVDTIDDDVAVASSPPLRDTRDVPRPTARDLYRPAPTGPLSSIAEAATRLAQCRSAPELGSVLARFLKWRFDRVIVLDLRPIPFRVLAAEGTLPLDEPIMVFEPARGFWDLVRQRQPYYGPPPSTPDWDRFFQHTGGRRPGAVLVATLRRAGTPALTLYGEHDKTDLYSDLSDIARLLKEAAAAMSVIAE